MTNFRVVDLFCGCGGFSWGFQQEGFEILLGVDQNSIALKTYARNLSKSKVLLTDLSIYPAVDLLKYLDLKPGELDCLIGGPPCQGFSKNTPAKKRDKRDPRNELTFTFLEFVKILQPKIVLMENVAEMKNAYQQSFTLTIYQKLKSWGYQVNNSCLLAADYGVPQLRHRSFFYANRLGQPVNFPNQTHIAPKNKLPLFNDQLEYITVWQAISDLPSLSNGEGKSPCNYEIFPQTEYQKLMRKSTSLLADHVARKLTDTQLERVKYLEPGQGQGIGFLPEHLRPKSAYSGAYARLIPDEPARTITRWVFHPGSGRFYHPFDNRVITIREAARIQSFSDDFVFEGTYIQKSHQVGEAVPPLLSQALAKNVKQVLLKATVSDLLEKFGER